MARGQDTGRHPNRQVGREVRTTPPGSGDYSNPETMDAREFDKLDRKVSDKHSGPLPIHKARGGA